MSGMPQAKSVLLDVGSIAKRNGTMVRKGATPPFWLRDELAKMGSTSYSPARTPSPAVTGEDKAPPSVPSSPSASRVRSGAARQISTHNPCAGRPCATSAACTEIPPAIVTMGPPKPSRTSAPTFSS